jgi:hypothetical protein
MPILFHGTTLWRASLIMEGALTCPTRGVLGLVDELLAACWNNELQLDWQADHCRVRLVKDGPEDVFEVPLRKSVFRAALARIGVLCNERKPNSVSPTEARASCPSAANQRRYFESHSLTRRTNRVYRSFECRQIEHRTPGSQVTRTMSCEAGRSAEVLP